LIPTARALAGLLLVALAFGACKQSPPAPPVSAPPTPASPPSAVASAPAPVPAPSESRPEHAGPHGTIKGKTVWPNTEEHRFNLQILLIGDDSFTEGKIVPVRTRLGEPYSAWVPAGGYLLRAQVGGVRLWELRVNVEADKETTVDLTPAESRVSPSEFPTRG